MVAGITNIGLWQCVDIGVWQSGCYSIIPNCGKLGSRPLYEGKLKSEPKYTGQLQSEPKITGKFGTPNCES